MPIFLGWFFSTLIYVGLIQGLKIPIPWNFILYIGLCGLEVMIGLSTI